MWYTDSVCINLVITVGDHPLSYWCIRIVSDIIDDLVELAQIQC